MDKLNLVPRALTFAGRLHRQHLGRLCQPEHLCLELPIVTHFIFRCLRCSGFWEVSIEEALSCPPS